MAKRKRKPRRSFNSSTREHLALPTPPAQNSDHYEPSGLICIVDVEKFSTIRTRVQQIRLVRELWHASQKTTLIQEADPPAHINGTGDGLLIAVRFSTERMKHALKWTRDLIHDAQIGQFNKKLRFGLHYGSYTILGGDPGKLAVGTALNECTRVCSVGDGGHVIVSEEFVKQYADAEDWPAVKGVFEPCEEGKYYTVSTKHGTRVPFRIYLVNEKAAEVPHRLKLVHVANSNIKALLHRVEESFRTGLRSHDRLNSDHSLLIDNLDIRVCLFVPDYEREILTSDEFRYHKENKHLRPSEAEYSIRGEGSGVCGQAFCQNQPKHLHRLPKRTDDKHGYDDAHVRLGVSQPSIERWQRHAQSLLAFPFAVMIESALGAVCIDVMDPLDWVESSSLESIGFDLMQQYGVQIGSLFTLRY